MYGPYRNSHTMPRQHGGTVMTDGCSCLGCRDTPDVVIALVDGRERVVCQGCARREIAQQDAKVIDHV